MRLALVLQPTSNSLVSENLLSIEDFLGESNLQVHYRLIVDYALARVAIINKELLVTYQEGLAFLDVARQATRLQIWL